MIIKYMITKLVNEEGEFEIGDTHHCFLQGNSTNMNEIEYLGIYRTEKKLVIIEIFRNSKILSEFYDNKYIPTETNIRDFLKTHRDVKVITEDFFRYKLDTIVNILKEEPKHQY